MYVSAGALVYNALGNSILMFQCGARAMTKHIHTQSSYSLDIHAPCLHCRIASVRIAPPPPPQLLLMAFLPPTLKIKLRGLSPRTNYTDRETAACRRSYCQSLRIEGATWSA
jgi:hypothetical protein